MAEVVGLLASVIQLAGAGLKLSQTLYQYAEGVATADRRLKDIAQDIKLTSLVIDELGNVFRQEETAKLISKSAVTTAEETMKECSAVFAEIDTTLVKSRKGKMGRLMLPFRDNKIELLRSHIDKLKSTLQLLMQVLVHAFQVSSNKLDREAEARQRDELRELLELQRKSTERYEDSLRNFSVSDSSTMLDDDHGEGKSIDETPIINPGIVAASAIASTITPETLAGCVQHVQSLLKHIETLQQALTQNTKGKDHSDDHQNLLGSYFRTRGHLDGVLLGGSTVAEPRSTRPRLTTNASALAPRPQSLKSTPGLGTPPNSIAPQPDVTLQDPTLDSYEYSSFVEDVDTIDISVPSHGSDDALDTQSGHERGPEHPDQPSLPSDSHGHSASLYSARHPIDIPSPVPVSTNLSHGGSSATFRIDIPKSPSNMPQSCQGYGCDEEVVVEVEDAYERGERRRRRRVASRVSERQRPSSHNSEQRGDYGLVHSIRIHKTSHEDLLPEISVQPSACETSPEGYPIVEKGRPRRSAAPTFGGEGPVGVPMSAEGSDSVDRRELGMDDVDVLLQRWTNVRGLS
ncbi:hypothetical protein T440DRAFT_472421 [Plenodomus tracheiphilus IPT5]|uniref:Fungal N-terminal domain-containing protein n=1 Tax=Plenodomus tracheiphilus IPT5 TaxID=1408161 RepID=A0A6A7ARU6_9PLEO|nr:hypothetical protein T440DRAFT_472421 [Plenodomus tracheiphilus IPT5]